MEYSWDLNMENYESFYLSLRVPCILSYSVTFLLGIVGNLLVIWVTGFKLKSVSAVWFLNLAVSDLICNVVLPLRIGEWSLLMDEWSETLRLCWFSTSLLFFNMLTSVYFLTIISIDRCVSVICPIWSKIHRLPRLAKIISGIIWIMCLIITVLYVTIYQLLIGFSDCTNKMMLYLHNLDEPLYHAAFTPKMLLVFAIPFLIISICSGIVVLKLKSLKRPLGSEKPFKVITAVVLCFFICWCPYNVWPLIPIDIGKYWKIDLIIHELSVCLSYFNCCLNPILYVAFSRDFKTSFTPRSLPARLKTVLNDQDETSGDNPTDQLNTSSV